MDKIDAIDVVFTQSFKPYYKWITFNIIFT